MELSNNPGSPKKYHSHNTRYMQIQRYNEGSINGFVVNENKNNNDKNNNENINMKIDSFKFNKLLLNKFPSSYMGNKVKTIKKRQYIKKSNISNKNIIVAGPPLIKKYNNKNKKNKRKHIDSDSDYEVDEEDVEEDEDEEDEYEYEDEDVDYE